MDRKETNMTEPNPWQAPEQPVPAPALPQAAKSTRDGMLLQGRHHPILEGYVRPAGRRSEYWWASCSLPRVVASAFGQSGSGLGALFSLERLLGTRHHPADHRHLMASPP